MVRFACPTCGKTHRAANSLVGKQGTCKSCGNRCTIPAPLGVPIPEAKPSSTFSRVQSIGLAVCAALIAMILVEGANLIWRFKPAAPIAVAQNPAPQPVAKPQGVKPAAAMDANNWRGVGKVVFYVTYYSTVVLYYTFETAISFGGAPLGAAVLVIFLIVGMART